MYKIKEMYDLNHTIAKDYLNKYKYPYEVLPDIKDIINTIGKTLSLDEYNKVGENTWIHKSVKLFPSAYIGENVIIGKDTEVRHCAFIRGNALIGENCVVGNSVEIKNAILFDNVQVPHYNYVGDSILGYKAHMGAGSITSNVKSDKSLVTIKDDKKTHETNLKKVGGFLGDYVEVGCNSVICPGTVIGRKATIYPLSRIRGTVKENMIYKDEENIVLREEK